MNFRLALLMTQIFLANGTLAHASEPLKNPIRNWGLEAIDANSARTIKSASASQDVIVAVIDTGVDVNHPLIKKNLWTNPGETGFDRDGRSKSNNEIDDDRNGFVDDVHGWNFVGASPDLTDRHGHGTHIAGIIGATANGGEAKPHIKIMSLKYYDPENGEDKAITNTVHAIAYAIKMGARVINYSAGGPNSNPIEKAAIEMARENGVLFVAAAGNDGHNSDLHRYYPADYALTNVLSVGAIDSHLKLIPSSNYGTGTVQTAAPGDEILSAAPGGKYGFMTGTSQATAFASAVAAMLIARSPELAYDPEKTIEHMKSSGIYNSSLKGKTSAQTVLNAYRALMIRGPGESAAGIKAFNVAAMDEKIFATDFDNGAEFPLARP